MRWKRRQRRRAQKRAGLSEHGTRLALESIRHGIETTRRFVDASLAAFRRSGWLR